MQDGLSELPPGSERKIRCHHQRSRAQSHPYLLSDVRPPLRSAMDDPCHPSSALRGMGRLCALTVWFVFREYALDFRRVEQIELLQLVCRA